MAAMDLLGRRWALRILWELRHGPLGARALRSRCDGMSSSVLYDRLRELTAAGLAAERGVASPWDAADTMRCHEWSAGSSRASRRRR